MDALSLNGRTMHYPCAVNGNGKLAKPYIKRRRAASLAITFITATPASSGKRLYFRLRPSPASRQRLLSGIRTVNRSIPLLGRHSTPLTFRETSRTHRIRSTVVCKFAESALKCHRSRSQRDCVSAPNILPFN